MKRNCQDWGQMGTMRKRVHMIRNQYQALEEPSDVVNDNSPFLKPRL